MGAILKPMNGLSFETSKELLKDFQCSNCNLFLNQQDIHKENYSFWLSDYANDLTKSATGTYAAHFWLKGVNHENCPENETCESCHASFRVKQIKEFKDRFYCEPCFREIKGEVKHE